MMMSGMASSETLQIQWTGPNGDEATDIEEKAIQTLPEAKTPSTIQTQGQVMGLMSWGLRRNLK